MMQFLFCVLSLLCCGTARLVVGKLCGYAVNGDPHFTHGVGAQEQIVVPLEDFDIVLKRSHVTCYHLQRNCAASLHGDVVTRELEHLWFVCGGGVDVVL